MKSPVVPSLRVKWPPPLIPLESRVAVTMPLRPSLQRTGIEVVGECRGCCSHRCKESDPLDTLKDPPLSEAVVVPRIIPPGMSLTHHGHRLGNRAARQHKRRSEQNQSAHSHPPGAFVIVVRRVGAM